MKKIPLQKLKSNLAEISLEFAMQSLYNYIMLQTTGVIFPLAFYRESFASLQNTLQLTGALSVLLAVSLDSHNDLTKLVFNKKVNDLTHSFSSPKNIIKSIATRILVGIKTGVLTGMVGYISLRISGQLYPELLVTDSNILNEFLEDNESSKLENVVHVPLAEEIYSRGLIMNGTNILLHGLFILGTSAYTSFTSKGPGAQNASANADENSEEDDHAIEMLNKNIHHVANFCATAEFALGHFSVQQPYTFFMGWCYGNLTNQYGDTLAAVSAHMVHNLAATTFPCPLLLEATGLKQKPY